MRLQDIENHLERADARISQFENLEALRYRQELIKINIRLAVAVIALLCAVSAIYNQF